MTTQQATMINGLDTQALHQLIGGVEQNPANGKTRWTVTTAWQGGARSDTRVTGYDIAGQHIAKDFTIKVDEPLELGGTNRFANPQEYLLASFNACMIVGYAAAAALHGIELTRLEILTQGDIDLRGFLGIDPTVKPGYDSIRYTVRIAGNGTPEQFRKIHEIVMATSPNRFNLASPIKLNAELSVL